jgi:GNAT superfamily N-acetyltransferase
MSDIQSQVEIVEYDQQYASIEDVRKVFITNFNQIMNSNNFNGIYLSMLDKYGILTYAILFGPVILMSLFFYLLLSYFTGLSTRGIAVSSAIMSITANYMIFGYYLVKRFSNSIMTYGHKMLNTFTSIEENYQKNGGNFWLATLSNPMTGKTEVIGQVGFVHGIPEIEEIEFDNYDIEKIGILEAISVNKKYRRMGIGKMLLEKAISYAEAENYDTVGLGVLSVNTAAVNLFKRYGFKVKCPIEADPITGLTSFFMTKSL